MLVSMLCLSLLHSALLIKAAAAQEQVDACWFSYLDCSRQAGGDPKWRSVCYADFARCVGRKPMPACPAITVPETCDNFKRECTEFAESDSVFIDQCNDDFEVCLFAHGC
jgi:hypothetical protein